jgi:hypothetical protein
MLPWEQGEQCAFKSGAFEVAKVFTLWMISASEQLRRSDMFIETKTLK